MKCYICGKEKEFSLLHLIKDGIIYNFFGNGNEVFTLKQHAKYLRVCWWEFIGLI